MSGEVDIEPMDAAAFAPFGDAIDCSGKPDKIINQGLCSRYHDRARLDFGEGRAAVSLFDAVPRALPYRLVMMERHPEGSQTFIPVHGHAFLVIVAPSEAGRPGYPRAFLTEPGQAVNLLRGTWHGVLTPLHAPGLFAVLDCVGYGENLEEYWFREPYIVNPVS